MHFSLRFDASTDAPPCPPHDLADQRQLLDVGTEAAVADLWTRYGLTHAQASARLADVDSRSFHNRPPAHRP
jgi:hypothetical protein